MTRFRFAWLVQGLLFALGCAAALRSRTAKHLVVQLTVATEQRTLESFTLEDGDFTADTYHAIRTTDRFGGEAVVDSWFDPIENALSIVVDRRFSNLLAAIEDRWTLFLRLGRDRKTVTDLRYTHSEDGDQDTVIDCVFP